MKEVKYKIAVSNWLAKAEEDIKWAKHSYRDKVYYGTCFICEQAAEKALKAFLLYYGNKFPKIHDLTRLIKECEKYQKNFSQLIAKATILSMYYIETRYPDLGEFQHYNQKQAKIALNYSLYIIKFVKKYLEQ